MTEHETPAEVASVAATPERTAEPKREFLLSYQSSRSKERELQLVELSEEEQGQSERLITQALTKKPRNLKKDRLYLGDYLFTKLVVHGGMGEEEFGDLWLRSARELYYVANELSQGKSYQEVDSSVVFLAGIPDSQTKSQLEKGLNEKTYSLDDFRVRVRTKKGEIRGKFLNRSQIARKLEWSRKAQEGSSEKVEEPAPEEQLVEVVEEEVSGEMIIKNEVREVKKCSLLRRVFSVVPGLAKRFYQFDLLSKTEREIRKHSNVAAVVGGAALLAIAADLHPEQVSEIAKQGLETVDVFIKSQGWQLTPLGQRTTEFIQEVVPQVQAFSQHQSVLLALGSYLTQEAQERWNVLSLAAQNAGLVDFSTEFVSFSKRVGESLVSIGQGVVDLANPLTRQEVIEKLAHAGIDSLKMGLDLVAKGAIDAKGFLSQIAREWGIENV